MKKKIKEMSVLAAVAVLAAAGITAWGQPNEPTLSVKWTAPTTGTAVEHYVGEVENWITDVGDTIVFTFQTVGPDTTASFTYGYGYNVRCRVAGVDSLGRQGPYSVWSDIWTDSGPPNAPSVPRLGLEMVTP